MVYRLLATLSLSHFQDWLASCIPVSVFSAGKGRSSADAWYSATLDVEESLGNVEEEASLKGGIYCCSVFALV